MYNNEILMKQIGNKCKEHRKSINMSLADVGRLAGVSRQAIYKFESGQLNSGVILFYYLVLGVDLWN